MKKGKKVILQIHWLEEHLKKKKRQVPWQREDSKLWWTIWTIQEYSVPFFGSDSKDKACFLTFRPFLCDSAPLKIKWQSNRLKMLYISEIHPEAWMISVMWLQGWWLLSEKNHSGQGKFLTMELRLKRKAEGSIGKFLKKSRTTSSWNLCPGEWVTWDGSVTHPWFSKVRTCTGSLIAVLMKWLKLYAQGCSSQFSKTFSLVSCSIPA